MGFWKRLFGRKLAFEDRVWRTEELKLEDLVRQAEADARDETVSCLVVYHFHDTGERLKAHFEATELECKELRKPGSDVLENLAGWLGAETVGLLDSLDVPEGVKQGQGRRSPHANGKPTHVHLAEHYPIPSRDDHVLELQAILPPGSEFIGYVGLDEPWLDQVLGSQTRALLDQLGMSGTEPLNHAMIGNALRSTQKQIDKQRRDLENYARSSGEWMHLNMSGGGGS